MPEAKTEKKPRGKNGRARPGSGRKPLVPKSEIARVRALIEQHSMDIDPRDKKSGRCKRVA